MVTLREFDVRRRRATTLDAGRRRDVPPKAKATGADAPEGGRTLVIVESPAKAKTIQGYLGPGY